MIKRALAAPPGAADLPIMKPIRTGKMPCIELAFSLLELLVVIAIIGVLASLLLPSLSRAKRQGQRMTCISNMRQLGIAMRMYLDENLETFPAASEGAQTDEEWILWDSRMFAPVQSGSSGAIILSNVFRTGIVPYISRFSTNLFTCPSDAVLPGFRKNPFMFSVTLQQWYPFSYTLNSPGWFAGRANNVNLLSHGIASLRKDGVIGGAPREFSLFRSHQIVRPSGTILFADERMKYEPEWTGPSDGISSGWNWPYDKVTSRHSARGNLAFADGHVETRKPEFADQPEHYDPIYAP